MVHYFDFNMVLDAILNVADMLNHIQVMRIFANGQFISYSLLQVLEAIFGIAVMREIANLLLKYDKGGVSTGL